MSKRGRVGWRRFLGVVLALTAGTPAVAQVTQTDALKTPLPQPVPAAELEMVNKSWSWNAETPVIRDPLGVDLDPPLRYGDFYAPPSYPQFVTGDALNLSGLFKWRKETIDPAIDAKTGPGHFPAKCGVSAELLLMGGNCQPTLGWYNVLDPASKTPPAAAEIYPLIVAPQEALQCIEYGTLPKRDGFCPLAWDNRGPYDLSTLRWVPQSFSSGDLSKDPRYKGGDVAFALSGDPAKCPQNKYSMYEHNQRNSNGEPWVTTLIYRSKLDPSGAYLAFEDSPMSPADWKKRADDGYATDGDFNDFVVYVASLSCPGEIDAACVGKSCPSGQVCQLGACKELCSGVVCPSDTRCVDGTCSSPPSGTGGSGGAAPSSGGSSSTGTGAAGLGEAGDESAGPAPSAGAAGNDDGAIDTAGADARAGATNGGATQVAPSQKSSSCGYALLAKGQSPRAWPVLGLAIGLALLRRRRLPSPISR
ncbi:MAG TPA: hypothetical protein VJV79_14500 [Polyangiaceae bacterium]|nr:hypothetical protein [Polyangiaceae bacterium]